MTQSIVKHYRENGSVYAEQCSECNVRWYYGDRNFQYIGGKDFLLLGRYLGKPPVRNKILVALPKHEIEVLDHILSKSWATMDNELEHIKYKMLWIEENDKLLKKYNLDKKENVGYSGGCYIRNT